MKRGSDGEIAGRVHYGVFRDFAEYARTIGLQNMATLPRVSHNLLNRGTSLKVGIQGTRLQAWWREDYLPKVLGS